MTHNRTDSVQFRVPDDLAQKYLRRNIGLTINEGSAKKYDSTLTSFVGWLHGRDKTVRTAETSDIVEFIEHSVRKGNREQTIKSKLAVITACYKFLRLHTDEGETLALDPLELEKIDVTKYITPDPINRVALSEKEIRKLFDEFDSYRNRLMAIVGIETGIRNSDIRNLRVENIQSDRINIRDPKGGRPYECPISNELSFEFEQWLKHHRKAYVGSADSQYVFPSKTGDHLSTNGSLNKIVKSAAESAGIQDTIATSPMSKSEQERLGTNREFKEWSKVTVHTLRHSYITLLDKAGVSLTYRMLVANHRNPATTLGYSSGESDVVDHVRERFEPPR